MTAGEIVVVGVEILTVELLLEPPTLEAVPPAVPGTVALVLDGLIEVVPPADVVGVDGVEVLGVVEPGPLTLLPVEVDDVVVEGVGAGPVPSPEPATPAKTLVSYLRVFSSSRACSSRAFSSLSAAARSIRSSLCNGVRQLCNSQPLNITQSPVSTSNR